MSVRQILECVPNFSEGRDLDVIDAIEVALDSVPGASVLHRDRGVAANRTVFTVAGEPDAVGAAAERGMLIARERIDMRRHRGEHPRMGACDVCPLIPIRGLTMDDAIVQARALAERVGAHGISGYLYEQSAVRLGRANLASLRRGEYESLASRSADAAWEPDFGPMAIDPGFGAVAIGARPFLLAYNVNLSTDSVADAKRIAVRVRTSGQRVAGRQVAGELEHVKAIGWFIEEFGCAQVSMNLTDFTITPIHRAFDAVRRHARALGIGVAGSELIGMIPLAALLEAGRHAHSAPSAAAERELLVAAVDYLGLSARAAFVLDQRVIEHRLNALGMS